MEIKKINNSNSFFTKVSFFTKTHKVWSGIIIIAFIAICYFSYFRIFVKGTTVQYTFGKVTKGDLVVSVSASGQVSTLSKVSIKPNTTGQTQTLGQIISVRVKNGDYVKAGDVIAVLDGKNALQTLNQAKASFTSAQANYDKVVSGLTESELVSLNNSIDSAETSLNNSKQNIVLSVKSAYTTVSNLFFLNTDAYFTSPTISPLLTISGVNFISQELQNDVNQGRYNITPLLNAWREKVKTQSIVDAKSISDDDTIQSINSVLSDLSTIRNYFDDMATLFALYSVASDSAGQTSLSSAKSVASSARGSIDTLISSFTSSLQSYNNSITSLEQARESLNLKQEPPSESDLATAQSSLDNAKANLANAETAYVARIITASFDGQIGGLSAEVGQQVSSSDSLGTLITSEKVINVTLNEVDAAKISAGDTVIITFDSLTDVSLTGFVSYIDPLGTVSSGVVSYAVQIKINKQNDQVKTGMTASVVIVTAEHPGALIIPTSAITTSKGKKYVLVANTSFINTENVSKNFNASSTTRNFASSTRATSFRPIGNFSASNTNASSVLTTQYPVTSAEITTGISNNTTTEVLSGLSEGQLVVTKKTTINGGTTTTKTSAASATTNARGAFGGMGGAGAIGGIIRN
ncbi:MAG: HlyD family efflux transporter periplasmic adaptor subunit [Minisyncoccia bacterium]